MPESRQRPGHHEHHEPSPIPSSQRTKGRTVWAILLAVLALGIAYFAAGPNYAILAIAAIAGGVIGYFMGKAMEKDAKK